MFARFLTDKQVEKRYVKVGATFGDAVSYIYMGECVGFEKLLAKWEKWEAEYAKRGYRTLPLDDFVSYGGYGTPLKGLKGLGEKRVEGEDVILHAKIYRDVYLGKVRPAVNVSEFMKPFGPDETFVGTYFVGTYFVPSTKKAE